MYYLDIYVHVQYNVHVVHVHVLHVSYKMAIVHNKNNTRNVIIRHICTCTTCSTFTVPYLALLFCTYTVNVYTHV